MVSEGLWVWLEWGPIALHRSMNHYTQLEGGVEYLLALTLFFYKLFLLLQSLGRLEQREQQVEQLELQLELELELEVLLP